MKPGSKKWKNFMAKLYGWGASLVIVGALFKIEHWPGASLFLVIGLTTEAVIFFFSAFEPPHEDPDWSLVYPELATGDRAEGDEFKKEDQRSVTEQLDDMLESAKIEPELIESLGQGLRSLSDQARQMNEITGAAADNGAGISTLMGVPLREARESFEREYLRIQIRRFSGNISKTAGFIGMERSALHRKLKLLGMSERSDAFEKE